MTLNSKKQDGYINATFLCKNANKLFGDYQRLNVTQSFLDALFGDMGIHISELIQVKKAGNPQEQGTWVHPQVAINLGQWLSPKISYKIL